MEFLPDEEISEIKFESGFTLDASIRADCFERLARCSSTLVISLAQLSPSIYNFAERIQSSTPNPRFLNLRLRLFSSERCDGAARNRTRESQVDGDIHNDGFESNRVTLIDC